VGRARLGPLQATKSKQSAAPLELVSNSAAQTRKLGKVLGELAAPGDVILLVGKLGSGKTCLAQGIAKGLGIDEYTPSPSFVLVREYQGRIPLYHIDLYRLDRLEEVIQLGLDDYLYGKGVSVVEWADRGLGALPEEHLLINIEHLAATKRRLTLVARGLRYTDMVSKLKTKLESTRI
jgi:tRNA threonylcarbamoyladenosine biosynthesis protein TsaE